MERFKIDNEQELILKNSTWILHINDVAQESKPIYLYKFYSLSDHNVDALEKSYIYMNNPKDFNDPFDCSFNLVKERQIIPIEGQPHPIYNDISNKRIACFSTVDLNPLMWAHYTDSYKGFVLKFKTKINITKGMGFDRETLMRVIYSNNPAIASENNPFINQYQLIIKLADWSYENEWRLIAEKKNDNADKIYYDKEDVEEIIFGYKFDSNNSKELHDRVVDFVKKQLPNVSKFIVGPDHESFRLKKTPLYYSEINKQGQIVHK